MPPDTKPDHDKEWLRGQVSGWRGLFVGQLSRDEAETFYEACRAGVARESYEGMAGLLGLSKIVVLP